MRCYRCKSDKDESEFEGRKSCHECRKKRIVYSKSWLQKLDTISVDDGMKRCSRCKVVKPLNYFFDNQNKCDECQAYRDAYYQDNKKKEIQRSTKSQNSKGREQINSYKRALMRKNPINYMLQSARCRAKQLGLPFDLTKQDITIPAVCPILGYELKISDKMASPASPSLDRIEPDKGYVKGNVQVISWRANDIKGNATIEELKKLVAYLDAKNLSA